MINYAPGAAVNSEYQGSYNALNQLTSLTTPDGSWSYTYDGDGQLTRAIFTLTNMSVSNQDLAYSYDPDGNLVSTIINGLTTNYTVNSMNEYTSIGGVPQVYDGDGNLLFDGATTYAYNDLNEPHRLQQRPGEHAIHSQRAGRAGRLERERCDHEFPQ